jgi:O-antigen/teichoic acid export membrane protein
VYASRSIKNFLSGTVLTVVTLLTGLVATPYLIHWLGSERFGAYRVLYEWAGYLVLLDFGLNEALIPFIAKHQANRAKAVATALRAHLTLIPVKLAASALLVVFAPSLIRVDPAFTHDLQAAMLLTAVSSTLFNPLLTYRMLMEVDQQSYRVNLMLTAQGFMFTVLSVFFAWKQFGITGQAAALFLACLPFYYLLSQYARTHKLFSFAKSDDNLNSELWLLRKPTAISNMCSRAGLMSDSMIISLLVNTSSVTAFYMTQRLINVIQGQLFNVGNSSWAALTDLHHQGQRQVVEDKLIELTRLMVVFGLVMLGPIVAFNRFFISRWVGAEQYGGDLLTLVFVLNSIGLALIALWSWIFGSTGKAEKILKPYLVFAFVNILSSLIFTRTFGLIGPALGTLTALLTVSLWALPMGLKREFGIRLRRTAFAVVSPAIILAPAIAAFWWMGLKIAPSGWVSILGLMFVSLVVLAGLAWFAVLTVEEKAHWRRRFQNLK